MAKFTVDTHLFRELGELLVGRDSTALVELLKNSYDADATEVVVHGENLSNSAKGSITISDNGIGMTRSNFENGFLRIASRIKEGGDRRSPYYGRRYTGAKGIGRLAAQKLAWHLSLTSIPDEEVFEELQDSISATIDWKKIDQSNTLDDQSVEDAISLRTIDPDDEPGTEIVLKDLRGRWTPAERTRVIREISTFQPPSALVTIPKTLTNESLLFENPRTHNVSSSSDPGFDIVLTGDFDVGDEYWEVVARSTDWILEIVSDNEDETISYAITPTKNLLKRLPEANQHEFFWENPSLDYIPNMNARVLIKEGQGSRKHQRWLSDTAGVRIYMEGFRVLPYGDSGDDWLEIDKDYTKRQRTLSYLEDTSIDFLDVDEDEGLSALRNSSYFGAVFLTNEDDSELDMLVNREGFVPNASFLSLQRIVRVGIDLSVRSRAYENRDRREERRSSRSKDTTSTMQTALDRRNLREASESAGQNAIELARQAREAATSGEINRAEKLIQSAGREIERSSNLTSELITERSIMQVLAGVGLQMAAFVHEMNSLLGMASAIEAAVESIRETIKEDQAAPRKLARLAQSVGDLRRVVERQASYLEDVTSPDARRRRSRQKLSERFDAAFNLVQRNSEKKKITVSNEIPTNLKSPPIFKAELTVIYSNLLSNAIKACNKNGKVKARGRRKANGAVVVTIENTGKKINLSQSEKWFIPFQSTTVESDPVLGQGMGMGLPIVRNILEEYGASINFVKPSEDFKTAIEITFT